MAHRSTNIFLPIQFVGNPFLHLWKHNVLPKFICSFLYGARQFMYKAFLSVKDFTEDFELWRELSHDI